MFSEKDINRIVQEKRATERELLYLYKAMGSCMRCVNILRSPRPDTSQHDIVKELV